MSKGVLGFGCSYTWAEGLYYYSDIHDASELLNEHHHFDGHKIRLPHILYKNKKSYINIIAQYYDTWSYVGGGNGGDNIFSFKQKINSLFSEERDSFVPNDFKLIIFQFTHLQRNPNYSVQEQIGYVDHFLSQWEELGIKCVSISWPPEIPMCDEYMDKFKDRHVPIFYNNIEYNDFETITHLKNNDITIESDFRERGLQKNDWHFNLKGHEMIADSIIKKLEKDNFKL